MISTFAGMHHPLKTHLHTNMLPIIARFCESGPDMSAMALYPSHPFLDTKRCASRHEHTRTVNRTGLLQEEPFEVWNGSWFESSNCALQCEEDMLRVNYQPFVCGAVTYEEGGAAWLHGYAACVPGNGSQAPMLRWARFDASEWLVRVAVSGLTSGWLELGNPDPPQSVTACNEVFEDPKMGTGSLLGAGCTIEWERNAFSSPDMLLLHLGSDAQILPMPSQRIGLDGLPRRLKAFDCDNPMALRLRAGAIRSMFGGNVSAVGCVVVEPHLVLTPIDPIMRVTQYLPRCDHSIRYTAATTISTSRTTTTAATPASATNNNETTSNTTKMNTSSVTVTTDRSTGKSDTSTDAMRASPLRKRLLLDASETAVVAQARGVECEWWLFPVNTADEIPYDPFSPPDLSVYYTTTAPFIDLRVYGCVVEVPPKELMRLQAGLPGDLWELRAQLTVTSLLGRVSQSIEQPVRPQVHLSSMQLSIDMPPVIFRAAETVAAVSTLMHNPCFPDAAPADEVTLQYQYNLYRINDNGGRADLSDLVNPNVEAGLVGPREFAAARGEEGLLFPPYWFDDPCGHYLVVVKAVCTGCVSEEPVYAEAQAEVRLRPDRVEAILDGTTNRTVTASEHLQLDASASFDVSKSPAERDSSPLEFRWSCRHRDNNFCEFANSDINLHVARYTGSILDIGSGWLLAGRKYIFTVTVTAPEYVVDTFSLEGLARFRCTENRVDTATMSVEVVADVAAEKVLPIAMGVCRSPYCRTPHPHPPTIPFGTPAIYVFAKVEEAPSGCELAGRWTTSISQTHVATESEMLALDALAVGEASVFVLRPNYPVLSGPHDRRVVGDIVVNFFARCTGSDEHQAELVLTIAQPPYPVSPRATSVTPSEGVAMFTTFRIDAGQWVHPGPHPLRYRFFYIIGPDLYTPALAGSSTLPALDEHAARRGLSFETALHDTDLFAPTLETTLPEHGSCGHALLVTFVTYVIAGDGSVTRCNGGTRGSVCATATVSPSSVSADTLMSQVIGASKLLEPGLVTNKHAVALLRAVTATADVVEPRCLACKHGYQLLHENRCACDPDSGHYGPLCSQPYLDGSWSDWSEWSCDNTCGKIATRGPKTRQRRCDSPATEFGRPCAGSPDQHDDRCDALKKCSSRSFQPLNYTLGPWSEWSRCEIGFECPHTSESDLKNYFWDRLLTDDEKRRRYATHAGTRDRSRKCNGPYPAPKFFIPCAITGSTIVPLAEDDVPCNRTCREPLARCPTNLASLECSGGGRCLRAPRQCTDSAHCGLTCECRAGYRGLDCSQRVEEQPSTVIAQRRSTMVQQTVRALESLARGNAKPSCVRYKMVLKALSAASRGDWTLVLAGDLISALNTLSTLFGESSLTTCAIFEKADLAFAINTYLRHQRMQKHRNPAATDAQLSEVESLCERLLLSAHEGLYEATAPGEVPRGALLSGDEMSAFALNSRQWQTNRWACIGGNHFYEPNQHCAVLPVGWLKCGEDVRHAVLFSSVFLSSPHFRDVPQAQNMFSRTLQLTLRFPSATGTDAGLPDSCETPSPDALLVHAPLLNGHADPRLALCKTWVRGPARWASTGSFVFGVLIKDRLSMVCRHTLVSDNPTRVPGFGKQRYYPVGEMLVMQQLESVTPPKPVYPVPNVYKISMFYVTMPKYGFWITVWLVFILAAGGIGYFTYLEWTDQRESLLHAQAMLMARFGSLHFSAERYAAEEMNEYMRLTGPRFVQHFSTVGADCVPPLPPLWTDPESEHAKSSHVLLQSPYVPLKKTERRTPNGLRVGIAHRKLSVVFLSRNQKHGHGIEVESADDFLNIVRPNDLGLEPTPKAQRRPPGGWQRISHLVEKPVTPKMVKAWGKKTGNVAAGQAERIGLRVGDVLCSVEGVPVGDGRADVAGGVVGLAELERQLKAKEAVEVVVWRPEPHEIFRDFQMERCAFDFSLDRPLGFEFAIFGAQGCVLGFDGAESQARQLGVQVGDLLLSIDGEDIVDGDPRDKLRSHLEREPPPETVALGFVRRVESGPAVCVRSLANQYTFIFDAQELRPSAPDNSTTEWLAAALGLTLYRVSTQMPIRVGDYDHTQRMMRETVMVEKAEGPAQALGLFSGDTLDKVKGKRPRSLQHALQLFGSWRQALENPNAARSRYLHVIAMRIDIERQDVYGQLAEPDLKQPLLPLLQDGDDGSGAATAGVAGAGSGQSSTETKEALPTLKDVLCGCHAKALEDHRRKTLSSFDSTAFLIQKVFRALVRKRRLRLQLQKSQKEAQVKAGQRAAEFDALDQFPYDHVVFMQLMRQLEDLGHPTTAIVKRALRESNNHGGKALAFLRAFDQGKKRLQEENSQLIMSNRPDLGDADAHLDNAATITNVRTMHKAKDRYRLPAVKVPERTVLTLKPFVRRANSLRARRYSSQVHTKRKQFIADTEQQELQHTRLTQRQWRYYSRHGWRVRSDEMSFLLYQRNKTTTSWIERLRTQQQQEEIERVESQYCCCRKFCPGLFAHFSLYRLRALFRHHHHVVALIWGIELGHGVLRRSQRALGMLLEFLTVCAVYGVYVQSLGDDFGVAMSPPNAYPTVSGANWLLVMFTLLVLLPVQYFVPWLFETAQSYTSLTNAPPPQPSRRLCCITCKRRKKSKLGQYTAHHVEKPKQRVFPLSYTQWRYLPIPQVFAGRVVRHGMPWTQEDSRRAEPLKLCSNFQAHTDGQRPPHPRKVSARVSPAPAKVVASKVEPTREDPERKRHAHSAKVAPMPPKDTDSKVEPTPEKEGQDTPEKEGQDTSDTNDPRPPSPPVPPPSDEEVSLRGSGDPLWFLGMEGRLDSFDSTWLPSHAQLEMKALLGTMHFKNKSYRLVFCVCCA